MINITQQYITTLEKRVGADAKSPLFAQLAHYYLEAKRAQDALRICDAGLANFPFYTTGHLIKGKVLVALNMQAEARREFEFVHDFLPNNETLVNLLAQMPPMAETTRSLPSQEVPSQIIKPEHTAPSTAGDDFPINASPEIQVRPEPALGFGRFEQATQERQPELTPSVSPTPNFFDELTQAPPTGSTEDTLSSGLNTPSEETPATFETSPFSEFNFPQPELLVPTQTPSTGFDFTLPTSEIEGSITTAPLEEESFEQYTSERVKELSGENTVTLEEYLSNKTPAPAEPHEFTLPTTGSIPTGVQNKIEELTNKLQSAGKITPVINFAQKETPAASEQDTPAGMGFVTPTLAEIYAKQGWFDDAIKAYKTLARNKPAEKDRYEKRISELEELNKKSKG
jgi:tetratricopeptide (TPR) repeat protein